MSKRPKRNSEGLTERTNRNEREFFVWHIDPACPGIGQSPLAIDRSRWHYRLVDADPAPKPCASSLLALASRVDEVPCPLFLCSCSWADNSPSLRHSTPQRQATAESLVTIEQISQPFTTNVPNLDTVQRPVVPHSRASIADRLAAVWNREPLLPVVPRGGVAGRIPGGDSALDPALAKNLRCYPSLLSHCARDANSRSSRECNVWQVCSEASN